MPMAYARSDALGEPPYVVVAGTGLHRRKNLFEQVLVVVGEGALQGRHEMAGIGAGHRRVDVVDSQRCAVVGPGSTSPGSTAEAGGQAENESDGETGLFPKSRSHGSPFVCAATTECSIVPE